MCGQKDSAKPLENCHRPRYGLSTRPAGPVFHDPRRFVELTRASFCFCQLVGGIAAHNNFSDSTLFAPGIMRTLKNAGKMDGVTFIDQVHAYMWVCRGRRASLNPCDRLATLGHPPALSRFAHARSEGRAESALLQAGSVTSSHLGVELLGYAWRLAALFAASPKNGTTSHPCMHACMHESMCRLNAQSRTRCNIGLVVKTGRR